MDKEDEIVHQSVLADEIIALWQPVEPGSVVVDATLGEGGHAEKFLETFPGITLLGVERDATILQVAAKRLARFGAQVQLFNHWFHDFFRLYDSLYDRKPDRILFDLGISMYHFKKRGLGFSFQSDEPLDMRLDENAPISAADIVNTYPEDEIAEILREYGEEPLARPIARRIVEDRKVKKISTAKELADLISRLLPPAARYKMKIHPATKCFQALRIAVNDEIGNLKAALGYAFTALNPGGRMGIIAYHSLEDREVKHFFKDKNRICTCPPELPICRCSRKRELELLTKKPVYPGDAEIKSNRAARSARLRVGEKGIEK